MCDRRTGRPRADGLHRPRRLDLDTNLPLWVNGLQLDLGPVVVVELLETPAAVHLGALVGEGVAGVGLVLGVVGRRAAERASEEGPQERYAGQRHGDGNFYGREQEGQETGARRVCCV